MLYRGGGMASHPALPGAREERYLFAEICDETSRRSFNTVQNWTTVGAAAPGSATKNSRSVNRSGAATRFLGTVRRRLL